ncbi:MAG: hypothetical protein IKU07_02210 [Oscillospiraceae bacterium]|nr:hypothetical protein [Oscillospiraceae bacterium]
MEKYYSFAGISLAVTAPKGEDFPDDVLAPFRVASAEDPHRFLFQYTQQLTPPEGKLLAKLPDGAVYKAEQGQQRYVHAKEGLWENAAMCCFHRGKDHFVELLQTRFPTGMTAKTLLNACAAEHLLAQAEGFVLHCSLIDIGGSTVVFTAPSGTGKSTQAALWEKHRSARICNGDRACLRLTEGNALAEGIPFSGSSRICESCSLPLSAIVYLTQAPQTRCTRLTGAAAFARVWEGISVNTWDRHDLEAVSHTLEQLLNAVPVYQLDCTPDESAVTALWQCIRK